MTEVDITPLVFIPIVLQFQKTVNIMVVNINVIVN